MTRSLLRLAPPLQFRLRWIWPLVAFLVALLILVALDWRFLPAGVTAAAVALLAEHAARRARRNPDLPPPIKTLFWCLGFAAFPVFLIFFGGDLFFYSQGSLGPPAFSAYKVLVTPKLDQSLEMTIDVLDLQGSIISLGKRTVTPVKDGLVSRSAVIPGPQSFTVPVTNGDSRSSQQKLCNRRCPPVHITFQDFPKGAGWEVQNAAITRVPYRDHELDTANVTDVGLGSGD